MVQLSKFFVSLFLLGCCQFVGATELEKNNQALTLKYDKPAKVWTEALPIGNGRLGAMVFGGVQKELIQINESTLWSGGPVKKNLNPDAFENLALVRAALAENDFESANKYVRKMQGPFTQGYLPLANIELNQVLEGSEVLNYTRSLSLSSGITRTQFQVNGVTFTREIFASAPANAIVIKIAASKKSQISLDVKTNSLLKFELTSDSDLLLLKGKAPTHVDPAYHNSARDPVAYDSNDTCNGMRFESGVKPIVKNGTVQITSDQISIRNADELILIVSAATSFNGYDKCPNSEGRNEHQILRSQFEKIKKQTYEQLRQAHLQDFTRLFNRVTLSINPKQSSPLDENTDQRLAAYSAGGMDYALEALYFQFGRYLLISSSRTPGVPANLQGIWNNLVRPPWSSNYTTNINTQMNYWAVESANLAELFSPLRDHIFNTYQTGKETAQSYYRAPGWVLHHNSDIWAATNPVGDYGIGDPMWANWYMGGNWMTRHLWDHYLYTQDRKFLAQSYPVIKGAAEFSLAWLHKNPDGYLITSPSTSPENKFYLKDKQKTGLTTASTMDLGIIKDLFSNTIAASEVLGIDKEFRQQLIEAKKMMLPFQIGKRGQLQEWVQDYEEVEPHHRHVSHMYAIHPAREITPFGAPELTQAAKRTMELRGDDGTGWSLAWKVNMWSRLLDGDHAYRLYRKLLNLVREDDPKKSKTGGAYPNLFDAHPPFQIDGNFGGTAGLIEMLLQSQNDEIHLLPALPQQWSEGKVTGLVARGNVVVDLEWSEGKVREAHLHARNDGILTVRANHPIEIKALKLKSEATVHGHVLRFHAKKNSSYKLN